MKIFNKPGLPFFFAAVCLLMLINGAAAQLLKPSFPDSIFSTYYHQQLTHFETLPHTKGEIIFLGNSITDGGEWNELFQDVRFINRGISGDITAGVIHRIDEVVNRKPAKIFLLIGVNDLARNITADSVVKNILWIADYVKQQSPVTKLYVQSILPVNNAFGKFGGHTNKTEQIKTVNSQVRLQAENHHYSYIDLYSRFCEASGKLNADLTNDGLHLTGEGFLLWQQLIYPYVFDAQQQPALIPLPQQLQWSNVYFPLYKCRSIVVKNKLLQKEAERLQQSLQQKGWNVQLRKKPIANEAFIELDLGNLNSPINKDEGYQLSVTGSHIRLSASTAHGIFNGLQTLEQLMRNGTTVRACEITDWPAFEWRGYMVDAGRNFQSVSLLKQQIEVMSRYKLNVFHFHITEDIAWRLAIKQYPELTAPENMLRNKGMYYTEQDMKELIAYCKERYITLIPEIDMPGHSAAFTRAMKTNMQTDSGLAIVKNMLREVIHTYDFKYFHIGGDEVRITNKNFLPEVTKLLDSMGVKTIGWEPGGNFADNTIRQLWMDDAGATAAKNNIQYIDSRHLYINHMDPLESVVTIFNRQVGNKIKGDQNLKGATLCLWPDRRVNNENDALKMNPVYPAMLAFSERLWRGGGREGWVSNVGAPNTDRTDEFLAFENRLLDHKRQYFSELPFPYVRQASTVWDLFGPYDNGGDLSKAFSPEKEDLSKIHINPAFQINGGTVVLRHWWFPLIEGAVKDAKENSTWYAVTKVWSDEAAEKGFWIGFNNLSRSPATNSPAAGTWDNHQSKVWVNGKLIAPPQWKRAGQKGHPEIPLIDEGYEYRDPTKINLQKGWNYVLIKAPIGSFKALNWQNPEKWMFTFVPVE